MPISQVEFTGWHQIQRWLSCPTCATRLKFGVELKCKESPLCLMMMIPFFSSVVYGIHWWSESLGLNGWKMRKQQRGICRKTPCFLCHFVLWPAESSLAYTRTLAGDRCALHTAAKPTEPVCGGFWYHVGFQWIQMGCCPPMWFPVCVNGTPEWRLSLGSVVPL